MYCIMYGEGKVGNVIYFDRVFVQTNTLKYVGCLMQTVCPKVGLNFPSILLISPSVHLSHVVNGIFHANEVSTMVTDGLILGYQQL